MSEPLYFKQLEVGPMQNYVYLFGDPETREAAVVDAAWDIDGILEIARNDGYTITKNLVTHFHPDHLGGDLMGHSITGATELAGEHIRPRNLRGPPEYTEGFRPRHPHGDNPRHSAGRRPPVEQLAARKGSRRLCGNHP